MGEYEDPGNYTCQGGPNRSKRQVYWFITLDLVANQKMDLKAQTCGLQNFIGEKSQKMSVCSKGADTQFL